MISTSPLLFLLLSLSLLLPTVTGATNITGKLGDAQQTFNNPLYKTYSAHFNTPEKITGTVSFTAGANGTGVVVSLNLKIVDGGVGPFGYHVHQSTVPGDGNCNGTLGHFDIYQRGQVPPCDPTAPQTCEIGDLGGKNCKIPAFCGSITVQSKYTDLYLSTSFLNAAFVGNHSVVIHRGNGSRLACADVKELIQHTPPQPPKSTPSDRGCSGCVGKPGRKKEVQEMGAAAEREMGVVSVVGGVDVVDYL